MSGDLQHGVAEIGWANLFVTPDRMRIMGYSNLYHIEQSWYYTQNFKQKRDSLLRFFPTTASCFAVQSRTTESSH